MPSHENENGIAPISNNVPSESSPKSGFPEFIAGELTNKEKSFEEGLLNNGSISSTLVIERLAELEVDILESPP